MDVEIRMDMSPFGATLRIQNINTKHVSFLNATKVQSECYQDIP